MFFFYHRIENCEIRISKAEQDEALSCLDLENIEVLPAKTTPKAAKKPKVQKKQKKIKISLKRGRQKKKSNEKFILKRLQLEDNEALLDSVDKFTAIKQRRSNFSSEESQNSPPQIKLEPKTSDDLTVIEEIEQDFNCNKVDKVKMPKPKQSKKIVNEDKKKLTGKQVKKAVWKPQKRLRMTRAARVKIEKSSSDINTTTSTQETSKENQGEISTQTNDDELSSSCQLPKLPSLEFVNFDEFGSSIASQESENLFEELAKIISEEDQAVNKNAAIDPEVNKTAKIDPEVTNNAEVDSKISKPAETDPKISKPAQIDSKIVINSPKLSLKPLKIPDISVTTDTQPQKTDENLPKDPTTADKHSFDLSHIPITTSSSGPLVGSDKNVFPPRAASVPLFNPIDFSKVFVSPEYTFAFFKNLYELRECEISLEKISPTKLEKILSKRKSSSVQITKSGRIAKPSEVYDPSPEPKIPKIKKNLKTVTTENLGDDGKIEMEVTNNQAAEINSPEVKKRGKKRKFEGSPNTPKAIKKLKLSEKSSKTIEKSQNPRKSQESKSFNFTPKPNKDEKFDQNEKSASNSAMKLEYPEDIPDSCEIEEGYAEYPDIPHGK